LRSDVPENVNFALKASILRLFLDSHSIPYVVSDATLGSSLLGSPSSLGPAEVGELTKEFTGIVACFKLVETRVERQWLMMRLLVVNTSSGRSDIRRPKEVIWKRSSVS
jgi:hypothetical protein